MIYVTVEWNFENDIFFFTFIFTNCKIAPDNVDPPNLSQELVTWLLYRSGLQSFPF